MITELATIVDPVIQERGFSGVVEVSRGSDVLYQRAAGMADRAHHIPNSAATRFAIASGVKSMTALAVMSLIVDGTLTLTTTVRSVVGDLLPLMDPSVTVRHLLAHTSGLGDYFDESVGNDIHAYVMPVPVHQLATSADYIPLVREQPQKFPPGQRFEYCNSGYVVLALVVESVSGRSFYDVMAERVFGPAGMAQTDFPRSDALQGFDAIGYIPADEGWHTNLLHLPVRGSGDGGAYSMVADIRAFWTALFSGSIVPRDTVDEMIRPQPHAPPQDGRYGLGFWLRPEQNLVMLDGYDAGVSFRSTFNTASGVLYTVMANTSTGAGPVVTAVDNALRAGRG